MKGFTTLVLVVVIATATVVMGQSEQDFEYCKAKTGASNADMVKLRSAISPTTRVGTCLIACVQERTGMMDKNNKIVVNVMKKKFEALKQSNVAEYNKLAKYIDECKAQEKVVPDKCDAAKNFIECVFGKQNAA